MVGSLLALRMFLGGRFRWKVGGRLNTLRDFQEPRGQSWVGEGRYEGGPGVLMLPSRACRWLAEFRVACYDTSPGRVVWIVRPGNRKHLWS